MGRYEPDAMNPGSLGHYWRSLGRARFAGPASTPVVRAHRRHRPAPGSARFRRGLLPLAVVAVCGELVLLAYFPLARLIVHGRSGPAARVLRRT
jgi:hypothetical protein